MKLFKLPIFLLILVLGGFHPLTGAPHGGSSQIVQIQNPSEEQLQLLPKNLSRWHLGAEILLPNPNGGFTRLTASDAVGHPVGPFLMDDETGAVDLNAGTHDFVIDLGDFYPLARFSSISFGAIGSIRVRASDVLTELNPERWVQLGREIEFSEEDVIDLRFPLTDTRFLWVQLDLENTSAFGTFNALGLMNLSNVAMRPAATSGNNGGVSMENAGNVDNAGQETAPYDYATLYSGARVTHVSSGDPRIANFLIDDDILTYYEFPHDPEGATFIIDLENERSLDYISLLMESGPGTLELYFADELPFENPGDFPEDNGSLTYWSHPATGRPLLLSASSNFSIASAYQFAQTSRFRTIDIPGDYLDSLPAPMSVGVTPGNGRVRIPVPNTKARYLIARWISESPIQQGLRIFEISLIGSIPITRPPVQIINYPEVEAGEFAALPTENLGPGQNIPPPQEIIPDDPGLVLPQNPPASF